MGSWVGPIISASPLFCVARFSLRSCILFCKGRWCGVFRVVYLRITSSGSSFVRIPSFFSWLGGKSCHGCLIPSCTGAYGWVGGRLLTRIPSCGWVVSFSAYPFIAARSRAKQPEACMGSVWQPSCY